MAGFLGIVGRRCGQGGQQTGSQAAKPSSPVKLTLSVSAARATGATSATCVTRTRRASGATRTQPGASTSRTASGPTVTA